MTGRRLWKHRKSKSEFFNFRDWNNGQSRNLISHFLNGVPNETNSLGRLARHACSRVCVCVCVCVCASHMLALGCITRTDRHAHTYRGRQKVWQMLHNILWPNKSETIRTLDKYNKQTHRSKHKQHTNIQNSKQQLHSCRASTSTPWWGNTETKNDARVGCYCHKAFCYEVAKQKQHWAVRIRNHKYVNTFRRVL